LDGKHKGCEDEPCAYCLPAWKDELERLKTLETNPFIQIRIRYTEKRVLAGALRAVREHVECEDEPCADCLQVCKDELARLKSLPAPMSPFTAFSLRYYEPLVLAGEMRADRIANCPCGSHHELPVRQTNDHPLNFGHAPVQFSGPPARLLTKEERDAV
jgi:hypothetical protein